MPDLDDQRSTGEASFSESEKASLLRSAGGLDYILTKLVDRFQSVEERIQATQDSFIVARSILDQVKEQLGSEERVPLASIRLLFDQFLKIADRAFALFPLLYPIHPEDGFKDLEEGEHAAAE
ncbi:uncharacterized protein N7503_001562 [Penicillium pulvis]|uniref:uncharacterized protein n=1 Tax=Penicillium pulvis TaxID=1562058 RepID=UPI002547E872|nr:uncharacterized protein N7503_001562 [Penicillium pulvis]KAJ5809344.1 hypothetical protein N7503_001562 [Penicillium pulvis]